ncbi:glutaredoxin family protein [Pseudoduganella sp. UC29_71]|uniref:glutaredoxin family protein n=1 Tax=Pseudoduganella sp. UC29_71 TaxID=3350174 RepID=UPI00366A6E0F
MKRIFGSTFLYAAIIISGIGIGYALPRIPGWLKPGHVAGNYSAYYPDEKTRVILYSTSWCGYCAKTRAYLAAHNIRYDERDIEKSPAAARQFAELGGGGVPVVLIGGRKIRGHVPAEFDAALKQVPTARLD